MSAGERFLVATRVDGERFGRRGRLGIIRGGRKCLGSAHHDEGWFGMAAGRLLDELGAARVRQGRVLAIGAPPSLQRRLADAGYDVDRHTLDRGPLAAPLGTQFDPPVAAWPAADAAYDAVLLLDELAFVVDEEAALREVARVLRRGGVLLLRVPNAGPLAWLDPYNAFRYVRDVTGRGERPPETRGIGWRRHYRRRDLEALLAASFRIQSEWTEGVGLAEMLQVGTFLIFRGAFRRTEPARLHGLARTIANLEARVRPGPWGPTRLVVATQRPVLSTAPT